MWKLGAVIVAGAVGMAGVTLGAEKAEDVSPFGIGSCHANNVSTKANERWMPQMAAIGIRVHRTVPTGWGTVEPQQGTFKWDGLDEQMTYLESQKITFGGILIGTPKWNTADPKGLPIHNIAGWSKYVGEVVKHCKGRIKDWEVWNEPPNGTAKDQTAADYAKIVMAAYDAAKAADPDCRVGIAAKSVAVNYLDQAIAAGAKGHFDYITLHPYEVGGFPVIHPGSEVVFLQIAGTVRKMLAVRDPEKVNCPIIFTELGYAAAGKYAHKIGDYSEIDIQAHAVVKYYTMGIAQGIACIQWFEGMDGDSGPLGLLDAKAQPRPSYKALGELIKHLGQKPTYLGWVMLNDKHYAFVFQGAGGTAMVTWASTLAGDKVDWGQDVKMIEPPTGKVTTASTCDLKLAPVIIDGVPEKFVTLAKANKNKPFLWGGNYTNAQEVSVTYGQTNVEKGLHTKSAETIAADVLAYGGSARVGTVPGGTAFMVDPNFLCYTSTPIEITVEVRRNENNDPAKLTLNYESVKGYKNAEAFEVPDNKDWHKKTWRIDDSQFVSQWAYNFTLNPGKYALKSVTVRKVGK